MFGKKKREFPYDPNTMKPVLHCSICTGEQTAGFRDLETGRFTPVRLIQTQAELQAFCRDYGIETPEKEY